MLAFFFILPVVCLPLYLLAKLIGDNDWVFFAFFILIDVGIIVWKIVDKKKFEEHQQRLQEEFDANEAKLDEELIRKYRNCIDCDNCNIYDDILVPCCRFNLSLSQRELKQLEDFGKCDGYKEVSPYNFRHHDNFYKWNATETDERINKRKERIRKQKERNRKVWKELLDSGQLTHDGFQETP